MVLNRAKNGSLTCKIRDNYLHSPYNPEKEAKRFVQNIKIQQKSIFIIFEPALGYILPFLIEFLPKNFRLMVISVEEKLQNHRKIHYQGFEEYNLHQLIEENLFQSIITEGNFQKIQLISWTQSTKLFEKEYRIFLQALESRLNQCSANVQHNSHMGNRRLRNSLRFIQAEKENLILSHLDGDVILVGPGPSLNSSVEQLKKWGKRVTIAALPSAVLFLKEHNIPIDLIFTSDPGYWASLHYRHFTAGSTIICPVDCYKDVQKLSNSIVAVQTGNPLSYWLTQEISKEEITVASFALAYLLKTSVSGIYLAGIDLDYQDIKPYCTPHSFDSLLESESHRLNSIHHHYFHRKILSTGFKKNPLSLFEQSLKRLGLTDQERVFTLTPSPLEKAGIERKDNPDSTIEPKVEIRKTQVKSPQNYLHKMTEYIKKQLKESEEFPFEDPICYLFYQCDPLFIVSNPYSKEAALERLDKWAKEIKEYSHELQKKQSSSA